MRITRKNTRQIYIGTVKIGGGAPISVQSMTKTDTKDSEATINQITELTDAGCEIVRVAVKDGEAVSPLKKILDRSPIPVIADIHFDYLLAVKAINAGVHGIRINPGNIGSETAVKEIVQCAKHNSVPIRVGVNAGSLEKELKTKYRGITAEALVESALNHIKLIEKFGHGQLKVSIKASDVSTVIKSYDLLGSKVDYPLHLGVTESGLVLDGSIKSSLALGILLSRGIGDTVRVSLTAPPTEEVRIAYKILNSLGIRKRRMLELISCPTCGRCEWDLVSVVSEIESKVGSLDVPLKVAVMGCEVNGPGEAEEADIGIAGGKEAAVLFKEGRIVCKVPQEKIVDVLISEIKEMCTKV